jgi:hypothetical protein
MLKMDWQPGKIDVAALQDDGVNGRLARRDFDRWDGTGKPPPQFGQKLAFCDIKRKREPFARRHDVSDQLIVPAANPTERDGLRRRFKNAGNVDQIDVAVMKDKFAFAGERVEETPQPESLGIRVSATRISSMRRSIRI